MQNFVMFRVVALAKNRRNRMRAIGHLNQQQTKAVLHQLCEPRTAGLLISLSTGVLWLGSGSPGFAQDHPWLPQAAEPPRLIAQVPTNHSTLLFVNQVLGNDASGDGSARSPFRTITRALQVAQPGTAILLAAGTYTAQTGEQFPLVIPAGVTLQADPSASGQPIRIRGGGEVAIASPGRSSGSRGNHVAVLGQSPDNIVGIEIQNPDGEAFMSSVQGVSVRPRSNVVENAASPSANPSGRPVTAIAPPPSLLPLDASPSNSMAMARQATSPPTVTAPALLPPTPIRSGYGRPQATQTRSLSSPAFPSAENERSPSMQVSAPQRSPVANRAQPSVLVSPPSRPGQALPDQELPTVTVARSQAGSLRSPVPPRSGPSAAPVARSVPIPVPPPASPINQMPPQPTVQRAATEPDSVWRSPAVLPEGSTPPASRPAAPVRTPQAAIEIPVPPPASLGEETILRRVPQAAPLPRSQPQVMAVNRPTLPRSSQLLPVPSQEPPLGYTGNLRRIPVPGGSAASSLAWSGQPAARPASLRYRVLVLAEGADIQAQVRSLVPGAFVLNYQGRTVMQTGAFSTRENAEEAARELSRSGLRAVIRPMD